MEKFGVKPTLKDGIWPLTTVTVTQVIVLTLVVLLTVLVEISLAETGKMTAVGGLTKIDARDLELTVIMTTGALSALDGVMDSSTAERDLGVKGESLLMAINKAVALTGVPHRNMRK